MRSAILILVPLLVLVLAAGAMSAPRELLLDVQSAPLAWGDSRLEDKVVRELSRNPELRIRVTPDENAAGPRFPKARTNVDSLLNWGLEVGGRYLLVVTVDKEALERRKGFSLPLVFHKWEVVGVIRGEFRLLDLHKGRMTAAEPFEVEMSGSRQFQFSTDDNRADPSLHIPATEKSQFFGELEDRLVKHLVKQVTRLTRGR